MAISKTRVWAACSESFEKTGKRPTQTSVREITGEGSFSTIGPFIKEWCESYLVDEEAKRNLPPSVVGHINLIWKELLSGASSEIEIVVEESKVLIEEANSRATNSLAEESKLRGLLEQLEKKYSELEIRFGAEEKRSSRLSEDLLNSQQSNEKINNRVHELMEAVNSESTLRREDALTHEKQSSRFQQELSNIKGRSALHQSTVTELKAKLEVQELSIQSTAREKKRLDEKLEVITERLQQRDLDLSNAKATIGELEVDKGRNDLLSDQLKQAYMDIKANTEEATRSSMQSIEDARRIVELEETVDVTKLELNKALEQISKKERGDVS